MKLGMFFHKGVQAWTWKKRVLDTIDLEYPNCAYLYHNCIPIMFIIIAIIIIIFNVINMFLDKFTLPNSFIIFSLEFMTKSFFKQFYHICNFDSIIAPIGDNSIFSLISLSRIIWYFIFYNIICELFIQFLCVFLFPWFSQNLRY